MPEISSTSISESWVAAVELANGRRSKEIANLIVNVSGLQLKVNAENEDLRTNLDAALEMTENHSTGTVSNTIFPTSLWDPSKARSELYERYLKL
jgi:hypothetical protein